MDHTSDATIEAPPALSSLEITIPPKKLPGGYRIALTLLAGGLMLIPLIYLGLLLFLAYLVLWHTGQTVLTLSDGPFFIFHVPMAFLGGMLLLFLIKPVFFRKRVGTDEALVLREKEQPLLFAYVRKLCQATGSTPPASIEVDCEANAHARLRGGMRSVLRDQLVLRVGLPLAGDLSMRQFTGVMAHELGHFNQRHGMGASYLIRRMSFFFARIVFQRDKFDERLIRNRTSKNGVRQLYYWCMVGPIEAARGVLWLMLLGGELLSCGVLRRMEYDADRMETLIAGTPDFVATSHRLAYLQVASQVSKSDLIEAWEARRLPDDLPRLMAMNRKYLEEKHPELLKGFERQETRWLDSHPSLRDRIGQAERMDVAPLLSLEAPAADLFEDFAGLSKRATGALYRRRLGPASGSATLVESDSFGRERTIRREAFRSLRHFMCGHVVMTLPIFPGAEADRPLDDLEAGKAQLHAARQAMRKTASELGRQTKGLGNGEVAIAASRAQLTLCDIFTGMPRVASARARATRTLGKTERVRGETLAKYRPFASAVSVRLTAALRMAQSQGMRLPRAGGGGGYSGTTSRRVAELVAVCRPLEKLSASMSRLGSLTVSIRVLGAALKPRHSHPVLVRKLLGETREAATILRTAWHELSPVTFPFDEATTRTSIGAMVVPKFPAEDNPVDTLGCAVVALNAYYKVVTRVLGELAQIAELCESALNLEAWAGQKEIEEAIEAPRSLAGSWRYWVGYGGRAMAGVTMFTLLVYLSIFPPVIPEMPWDTDSPGGYQPNSFHVPFTPAASTGYQPASSQRPDMWGHAAGPTIPTMPNSQRGQPQAPAPRRPGQMPNPNPNGPAPWQGGGNYGRPSPGSPYNPGNPGYQGGGRGGGYGGGGYGGGGFGGGGGGGGGHR